MLCLFENRICDILYVMNLFKCLLWFYILAIQKLIQHNMAQIYEYAMTI